MGIKIGLTGHTNNFGPYIVEELSKKIIEVNKYSAEKASLIGFSRSTGHDITNVDQVAAIFDNTDLTLIINCAEAGPGQLNVAKAALANGVQCLNIGSKITEVDVTSLLPEEQEIKANKVALKEFSEANGQGYITFGFIAPNKYIDINPAVEEKNMNEHRAAAMVVSKLNDMGII